MSDQSERERFDKRISDLVAHRTPDELARDLLNLQDAQQKNAEEEQRRAEAETPTETQAEPVVADQPVENPLQDEGDDKPHSKRHKR